MSVEGFAAIPNWMIRDQRFSRRAILVYASLASRSGPGGIFPSQQTIANEMGVSERTVRTALSELEELGVIERVRRHSTSRGKATRMPDGYVLLPNGKQPAELAASNDELPATTEVATGKIEQVTPLIEEEPVKKSLSIVSPSSDELFEAAWKHWPRSDNKKKAREKFGRLKNQVEVAAAIVEHGQAHAQFSGPYVPHLITWLNGERWNDPLPGPRQSTESRTTLDIGREAHEILKARAAARERQQVTA